MEWNRMEWSGTEKKNRGKGNLEQVREEKSVFLWFWSPVEKYLEVGVSSYERYSISQWSRSGLEAGLRGPSRGTPA